MLIFIFHQKNQSFKYYNVLRGIMEAVCVKLDESVLKIMNNFLKEHNFSTKTDFIREAIRDKIRALEKENAVRQLEKYFGAAKTKTTYAEERKIREEISKKFAKKFGIKLD